MSRAGARNAAAVVIGVFGAFGVEQQRAAALDDITKTHLQLKMICYCAGENMTRGGGREGDVRVYTPEEVREMDGTGGKPLWVTYRGEVFDVTKFKSKHPGGKMIEQAAGE